MPFQHDIAIIGAGPVGLFAVFQAGMLGLNCIVLDALAEPGGQCSALYPEKPIYDIPGHPRIAAQELVDRLHEQAAPFKPVYRLGQAVTALTGNAATGFNLTLADGGLVSARAVIIAAGGGAFGPNRPPLPGIEGYEGSSVFYLVRRRDDFRGKRVVIAGGGDSAVDWALSLADVADRVMVVHRRPRFRAAPDSERRLNDLVRAGRIDLVVPYQLYGLEGAEGHLSAVIVRDLDGGERRLAADVLLPFFGLAMELGPIAGFGLDLARNHIAVTPATCATSAPGIHAVGDICTYPGKLKLILTGFAEAATAAHVIWHSLNPGRDLHFEHSTTRGLPPKV
jgi:thioredoxin reductase (NADPH)